MEYTTIEDPAALARESLRQTALQKEELAYQAECQYDEGQLLIDATTGADQLDNLRLSAAAKRKEADAYAKAADVSEDEIRDVRRGFLKRWINSLESSHIAHSAILKVKRDLEEPTADYDSILDTLDKGHGVATKRLSEIDKAKRAPVKK